MQTPESRVIIDCGVNVASDKDAYPHLEVPEFNIQELDAVIITHSHLDHSGAVPIFHITNDTPVYGTQPTFDLTELLITDFIHLSGYYLPYEFIDLQSMNACCRDIGYRNPTRVKSMKCRHGFHL